MEPFTWVALLKLISTYFLQIAAVAFSIIRQQQLAKKMRQLQDASKGLEVPTEAEVKALGVAYGRCLVGGVRVFHRTANNFIYAAPSTVVETEMNNFYSGELVGGTVSETMRDSEDQPFRTVVTTLPPTALIEDMGGNANEFLFVQQAICMAGVSRIRDVKIDPDRFIDSPDFIKGIQIYAYSKGNIRDNMMFVNFPLDRANALFNGVAYASMVFKIDDKKPQFNGIPDVRFMIEGNEIYSIVRTGSSPNYVYTVSTEKTYSNNPALVMMDYLTNDEYGEGVPFTEIHLESFYNAAVVCDKVVQTPVKAQGRVWIPTREASIDSRYTTPIFGDNNFSTFLNNSGVWDSDRDIDTFSRTYAFDILTAGTHTISLASNGDGYLRIDGSTVLTFSGSNSDIHTQNISLSLGQHSIEIQSYVDSDDDNGKGVAVKIDSDTKNVFNLRSPPVAFSRSLPLYEFNAVLDPENPLRDNIEVILETMNEADLVWTDGQYKLLLQYPENEEQIIVAGVLTDDDLVFDNFDIKWPSASERLNFCTVKYSNEALDFADDTVSWPLKSGSVYTTYLEEDNGIRLEADFYEVGIKDRYHALAKAEERVRKSRNAVVYTFSVLFKGVLYESGDIIKISSDTLEIENEYIKLQDVKFNEKGNLEVTGTKYNWQVLAWNVKDDEILSVPTVYSNNLLAPGNLRISDSKLIWDDIVDTSARSYEVFCWRGGSAYQGGIKRFAEEDLIGAYSTRIMISEIYKAFYQEAADFETIANWLTGTSYTLVSVVQQALDDPIVQAYFAPGDSNSTFIDKFSLRFLGNPSSVAGKAYLTNVLSSKSRAELIAGAVQEAYNKGWYFRQLGTSVSKEFQLTSLEEGVYAFMVRGVSYFSDKSDFGISSRMFEIAAQTVDDILIYKVTISGRTILRRTDGDMDVTVLKADLRDSDGNSPSNLTYRWWEMSDPPGDVIAQTYPGYATKYGFRDSITADAGALPDVSELGLHLPISNEFTAFGKAIVISKEAVMNYSSLMVEVKDNDSGIVYVEYITVADLSDSYTINLISTAGDVFKNGEGSTLIYPEVYLGEILVTDLFGWQFKYFLWDADGDPGGFVDVVKSNGINGTRIIGNTAVNSGDFILTLDTPLPVTAEELIKIGNEEEAFYFKVKNTSSSTTITCYDNTTWPTDNVGFNRFLNYTLWACVDTADSAGSYTTEGGGKTIGYDYRITVTSLDIDVKGTIRCIARRP